MPVTLTISGGDAREVLRELTAFASPLFQSATVPAVAQVATAVVEEEQSSHAAGENATTEDGDTTKRKRRPKAEIEAAKAAEAAGTEQPATTTTTTEPVVEESVEDLLGDATELYALIDPDGSTYDSYASAGEWGNALLELVEAAKDESELKALSGNNRVGATRLQAEGHNDIIEQMKSAMGAKAASFQTTGKAAEPELTFQMIYDAFVKLAGVKGKGVTTVRALLEKLGVPKLRGPQQKSMLPPEKFAEAWALVQAELKDA
jgi:hypothetical protein